MANDSYFLDSFTTLTLETDETTATDVNVAGIQDVEIVASVEIERLMTADSIKVDAQKQHSHTVDVNIGFSFWDVSLAQQWLGGGGDSSSASMTDTNNPQEFAINTFDIPSTDGGTTLSTNITGITFEEMPLVAASQGEYVQWNLSGTGTDVSDASTS